MNDKPSDDVKVGPWARKKLDALGRCLDYYTTALKNQTYWCRETIFVDAFAGPGQARIRKNQTERSLFDEFEGQSDPEANQLISGSPRVALEITTPFSRYIFIERNADRLTQLQYLEDEYRKTRKIEIYEGDANEYLRNLIDSGIDWRWRRGFIFLDPFGMHVPWSTITALAETGSIEVLVNFPLGMAIQRELERFGQITPSRRAAFDTFFGSPDWWDQVYSEEPGFFGANHVLKFKDSGERLLGWYRARLKQAFGLVSVAKLIRNTRGGHLYYLIWAGRYEQGLKGADYILSMGETVRSPRA
jgi:three-Cys-motif partner protein